MNGEKNSNSLSVKSLDKSLRQTQVGNVKLVIWAGGFVIQSISAIFKIIVKLGIFGEDRIGSGDGTENEAADGSSSGSNKLSFVYQRV